MCCILHYISVFHYSSQPGGWCQRGGGGAGKGSPDSSPRSPPDTVSPTPVLGEDDDDSLLYGRRRGEHAGRDGGWWCDGVELLRLTPQNKTVGFGPSSKVGGAGLGVSFLHHTISHIALYVCMCTHTMCAICFEELSCILQMGNITQGMCATLYTYSLNSLCNQILCVLPPSSPLPSTTLLTRCYIYYIWEMLLKRYGRNTSVIMCKNLLFIAKGHL